MTTNVSRIQLSKLFDEWNSSGSPLVGTHAATHLWVYRLEIPDDSQVDNAIDVKWSLVCYNQSGAAFFYSSSPEDTPLWTTNPHILSTAKLRQIIRNLTLDFLPQSLPRFKKNDFNEEGIPPIPPGIISHYGSMTPTPWVPWFTTRQNPVVPPMPLLRQTAAEKFDKIPPWCVVKKGDDRWGACSHDDTTIAYENGDWMGDPLQCGNISTESEARRVARLTRPLPSWEPAPDCPLPVEGWGVSVCDGRFGIAARRSFAQPAQLFDTRRAAIVWAWTEAPAPDDRKPVEATPHTVQFEHAPKVIREVPVLELLQAVCPHCREALRRLLS